MYEEEIREKVLKKIKMKCELLLSNKQQIHTLYFSDNYHHLFFSFLICKVKGTKGEKKHTFKKASYCCLSFLCVCKRGKRKRNQNFK